MTQTMSRPGPLAGLTVVELADGVAGPLAGLHCELLGAEVVKVEFDDGDRSRRWGGGAVFGLLNSGKRCITTTRDELLTIFDGADAVIVDRGETSDRIVEGLHQYASIKSVVIIDHDVVPGGFGSSETTAQAAAAYPNYLGESGERPLRLGADMAWSTAGVQAVQATLAHIFAGERGRVAVVSPMRGVISNKTIQIASRSDAGAWTGYHVLADRRPPDRGYRANDGQLSMEFPPEAHEGWKRFCCELGLADVVGEPDWYETTGMGALADQWRTVFEQRLAALTRAEVIDRVRRNGGWAVPFQSGSEVRSDPQNSAYGSVYVAGQTTMLRSPWRLNDRAVSERPVGQRLPSEREANAVSRSLSAPSSRLPLQGIRVVDLGIGGVGPWAGSQLAQLGATVVKVEAPNEFILQVMPPRGAATTSYAALNVGKASIQLNLKDPADREIAWALIDEADVLLENFRAGAMDRLGFGFEAVAARNERIVYCTANGFGSGGPMAGLPCTDPHMQAFGGFSGLNGSMPGGERLRYYGSVDLFTSSVALEGILAGLLEQRRSGIPQRVEVTMLAATTTLCLSQWGVDIATDTDRGPAGSVGRHTHPDGLYRTLDRPIALTVWSDEEFVRLCSAIGAADLACDSRFASEGSRVSNAVALDELLETVFQTRPADWWLTVLRRAGITSGPCNTERELLDHVEAWQHGHLRELRDANATNGDRMIIAGPAWDFSGVDASTPWAPDPGEHTTMIAESSDRWAVVEDICRRPRALPSSR